MKSPVELLASGARVMGFPLGPSDYGWQLSSFMNQHPYFPPNVSGWPEGTLWLNAGVDMTWGGIVQDFAAASAASSKGMAAKLWLRESPLSAPAAAARLCGITDLRAHRQGAPPVHDGRVVGPLPSGRSLALLLVSPEFLVN